MNESGRGDCVKRHHLVQRSAVLAVLVVLAACGNTSSAPRIHSSRAATARGLQATGDATPARGADAVAAEPGSEARVGARTSALPTTTVATGSVLFSDTLASNSRDDPGDNTLAQALG